MNGTLSRQFPPAHFNVSGDKISLCPWSRLHTWWGKKLSDGSQNDDMIKTLQIRGMRVWQTLYKHGRQTFQLLCWMRTGTRLYKHGRQMSQLVHWMRTWPRLYTHGGQSSHKVYWMRNRTNASHVADKPLSRFDEWGHDQDLTRMVNTPLSGFTKWGQQYSKTRSCLLWTRSWRTCCWHFSPFSHPPR